MSDGMATRADASPRDMVGSAPPKLEPEPENEGASRDSSPGVSVALVRVAVELTDAEKQALAAALERRCGHAVRLDVEIDSRILGGVWVRLDDSIIDGSLHGRLEALRHHLRASSRAMALSSAQPGDAEGGS